MYSNVQMKSCRLLREINPYSKVGAELNTSLYKTLLLSNWYNSASLRLFWSSWFFMHQIWSGPQVLKCPFSFGSQIGPKCLKETQNFHYREGINESVQQSTFTRFLTEWLNCCSMTSSSSHEISITLLNNGTNPTKWGRYYKEFKNSKKKVTCSYFPQPICWTTAWLSTWRQNSYNSGNSISGLSHTDDLKIFSSSSTQLKYMLNIALAFSSDIKMKFVTQLCLTTFKP